MATPATSKRQFERTALYRVNELSPSMSELSAA